MSELTMIEGDPRPARESVDLLAVARQAEAAKELGKTLIESGFLPDAIKKPEQAMAIMLTGQELNLPTMFSLKNITVIQGTPAPSEQLIGVLIRRAGHKLRLIESTNDACTVEGVRADDPEHPQRITFSLEDAKRANLLGKNSWKNYPRAMLRARAKTELGRAMFEDALAGFVYSAEELGAEVDEEGRPVEGNSPVGVHREPPEQSAETDPEPEPEVEDAEVVEASPDSGADDGEPIPDTLYVELVKLLDELYYEKSDVMDGHEWFEKEWGKWLSDLTRREAEKLIDTVNARLAKKSGREGAET